MKGFALTLLGLCTLVYSCKDKSANEPKRDETPKVDTNKVVSEPNNEAINSPYAGADVSPMDMTYFPVDYPKLKMAKSTKAEPLARVIYSRPHLQGRSLFPAILKYGEQWRLGANEATELDLFAAATIQDKKIPAGRYVLYCIPQADNWTIVINSNIDTWGLQPDSTKDIARFQVPTKQIPWTIEYFSMLFQKSDSGAELLMAWDNVEARLPFRF